MKQLKLKYGLKTICTLLILFQCSVIAQAGYLKKGTKAPSLGSASSYNTSSGKAINIESYKGLVVLVDFWATWCGPCIKAMPHMQELHHKYGKKGLVVIAHTDSSSRGVESYIKKNKFEFMFSIAGSKGIGKNYGVSGIPSACLIDVNGAVIWQGHSASVRESDVENALKKVSKGALMKLSSIFPMHEAYSKNSTLRKIQKDVEAGKMGKSLNALESLLKKDKTENKDQCQKEIDFIKEWLSGYETYADERAEKGDALEAKKLYYVLYNSLSAHDARLEFKKKYDTIRRSSDYKIGEKYTSMLKKVARASNKSKLSAYKSFLKKNPEGYYSKLVEELMGQL